MDNDSVARLVPTKSEAEIAADLKRRVDAAMEPVMALFDEAAQHGLLIQWDTIAPAAPYFRHGVRGLRVAKHY